MTEQTITVYRGEAPVLNFTMDPVPAGGIAGWALVFTVAKKANSATKLITAVPSIISGPLGTMRVVSTAAMLDLSPGTYFFDVWRMDAGFEEVLASGPFVIEGDARLPLATP